MAEYYYTTLILDKLDNEELPVEVTYVSKGIKVDILDIIPNVPMLQDSKLALTYNLAITTFPFIDFMSIDEDRLYENLTNEISAVKFLEILGKRVDKSH